MFTVSSCQTKWGGGVMAFRAFTRAATNAAGPSRLVGLLLVPSRRLQRTRWPFFLLSPCSCWDVSLFCDVRPLRLSTGSYHVSMMVC